MGLRVIRIECQGALKQVIGLPRSLRRNFGQQPCAHAKIVGFDVFRPLARRRCNQPPGQGLDNPCRYLVLHREDILKAAIEALGPQVRAAGSVDQLHIDADFSRRPPGTALQQVADAEIGSDPAHIHRLALVGEA